MSAINPDEIISILKEEIENYDEISQNQEVGTVISVGDGIATVYGIDHAMYGEVVVFENGLKGMVQDIRTNSMGCILFGKDTGIKEGTKVNRQVSLLVMVLLDESSMLLEPRSTVKVISKNRTIVR